MSVRNVRVPRIIGFKFQVQTRNKLFCEPRGANLMQDLLGALSKSLAAQPNKRDERVTRHSRTYKCRCGAAIFFDNTRCVACKSQLGLLPDETRIATLDP